MFQLMTIILVAMLKSFSAKRGSSAKVLQVNLFAVSLPHDMFMEMSDCFSLGNKQYLY